jgi:hypothetical protein
MCADRTSKELRDKSQLPKKNMPTGIPHQSSEEQFKIGDREKALLKDLFDWSERSSETHWVLGKPLGVDG